MSYDSLCSIARRSVWRLKSLSIKVIPKRTWVLIGALVVSLFALNFYIIDKPVTAQSTFPDPNAKLSSRHLR